MRPLRIRFLVPGAIAVVAGGIFSAASPVRAGTVTPPAPTQYDAALASVVSADVASTVRLPSGQILWIFGDTTMVNGHSVMSGYGYPHQTFALQPPGQASFTMQPGSAGYGWQQVPNWPADATVTRPTFFWAYAAAVYHGTLYVLGERTSGLGGGAGPYVAEFSAYTLAYEQVVPLTPGYYWSGVTRGTLDGAAGWWVASSGAMAWVPLSGLATPAAWTIYPASLPGAGFAVTLRCTCASGWRAFAMQDGTGQIVRYSAPDPRGPWTLDATWQVSPVMTGDQLYSAQTHPNEGEPGGQVLVTYAENGSYYHPSFTVLPLAACP